MAMTAITAIKMITDFFIYSSRFNYYYLFFKSVILLHRHHLVSFPPFFPKKSKIKNQLRFPICNSKKQSFETQDTTVMNMRMNSSNVLNASSGLGIIRIIDNQTGAFGPVLGTHSDFRPQLKIQMIKKFSPINRGIVHKTVEYILFTVHQVA